MPGAEGVQRLRKLLDEILATLPQELRREALTHVSYANENPPLPSNERLEYLGDAVLYLSAGAMLFELHPDASEGDLTRMRAHLVSGATLANIAREGGLGERLLLGKGEVSGGGRKRPSILAGALEAVIGAVFLNSGWDQAFSVCSSLIRESMLPDVPVDAKTLLQEKVQSKGIGPIEYRIVKVQGPPHMPVYTIACVVGNRTISLGTGSSKKEAEENAAGLGLMSNLLK